jgi:carbonic anhydrase
MKKLIKGLHTFQTTVFPIQKDFFESLVTGQKPEILFITCSDSRINPQLITTTKPGEMFILRNAGNIIPQFGDGSSEEATVEFAVSELGVKDIILCGHFHCGAIQAALDIERTKKMPSLYSWVNQNIIPTLDFVEKNYEINDKNILIDILIQEHVLAQLENLKTHPAIINNINKGLSLHGWIYKFETGEIFAYDALEGQFNLIKNDSY